MDKEKRSNIHSVINVESSELNALDISELLSCKFDYVVKRDMYKPHKNTLAIYDFLRQVMMNKEISVKTPIITLSPDTAISGATIAGVTEKFMYIAGNAKENGTEIPIYKSHLKVIYIDSSPDLSTKTYTTYGDFVNSINSDVIGLTDTTYTLRRVQLPPENLYLVGINQELLNDDQEGMITKENINMFSLQLMRKKGIQYIMDHICEQCRYDDVHIVIDLACVNKNYAPSVYRECDKNASDGFDLDQIQQIVTSLKKIKSINSIDITGYHFGNANDRKIHHVSNMLTIKTIDTIINSFIDLKQKTINIFDEDSKFLIFKLLTDDDPIGWVMIRNMTIQEKEKYMKQIGDGEIKIIQIDDNGSMAYITVTSMRKQQEKSYYTSKSVYDCCLFPEEKKNMMFELITNYNPQQNYQDKVDKQDNQKQDDQEDKEEDKEDKEEDQEEDQENKEERNNEDENMEDIVDDIMDGIMNEIIDEERNNEVDDIMDGIMNEIIEQNNNCAYKQKIDEQELEQELEFVNDKKMTQSMLRERLLNM